MKPDRKILIYSFQWLTSALLLFGLAAQPADAARRVDFRFASLNSTYVGMHVKESRMAMEMATRKVIFNKHPEFRLHLDFIPRDSGLVDTIIQNRYDVLAFTGLDYLMLKDKVNLRPLIVLSSGDQPTDPCLLLGRKGTTLKSIARQNVRTMVMEAGGLEEAATLWLDAVLEMHGLPSHERFFTALRSGDKPSRTILPVFFGQADLCVVSRSALEVMTELNPQIKEKITVLERSGGFINALVCATDLLEDWAKDIVLEETARIHMTPAGQQMLTIIRGKRFFPFKPEYIEPTEKLYRNVQLQTREDK